MAKSKNYLISETANNLLNTDSLDDAFRKDSVLEPVFDGINRQQGENNFDVHYSVERTTEIDTAADAIVAAHTGEALVLKDLVDVDSEPPFANKKINVNGVEKSLFKRVHGCTSYWYNSVTELNENAIPAGQTGYIELAIPYAQCKFTAAEIIGVAKGDTISFYILDTATNTYSGAPVETYGANFPLNQFGFDVRMPTAPKYKDTSAYDADLYQGMLVMCAYKNNGASARIVDMNVTLHEVK